MSFITVFVLKSILFDLSISFLVSLCMKYPFPSLHFLCVSLLLKWICICCRQHIDGSCVLFIQPLCLLIEEFIPFAFKLIINRYCLLPYYCFLTVFYSSSLFLFCLLFVIWLSLVVYLYSFLFVFCVSAMSRCFVVTMRLTYNNFYIWDYFNWWQLKFDTIVKLNIILMFLMSHCTSFYLVCPLANCCNHSYFYYFFLLTIIIPL